MLRTPICSNRLLQSRPHLRHHVQPFTLARIRDALEAFHTQTLQPHPFHNRARHHAPPGHQHVLLQHLLLATWQLVFFTSLLAMEIHASCLSDGERLRALRPDISFMSIGAAGSQISLINEYDMRQDSYHFASLWLVFLFAGAATDLFDVVSLVKQHIHHNLQLQTITISFAVVAAMLFLGITGVAVAEYSSHRGLI
ncbi:hypothetical protein BJ878DRAFT_521842, partial [Calycina marina]